jgi:hypothetical protein
MTKKAKAVPVTVDIPPLPAVPAIVVGETTYTPSNLAALAREVAMDIKPLPDILKVYKLSEDDYLKISKIPFYCKALEAAAIEWNSALSTHDRIRIEAAAIMEDAMPGLSARMKSRDEALPAAIEAGKLFAKLAGLGEVNKAVAGSGEKFQITIDLGSDRRLEFTKDVTPVLPLLDEKSNVTKE